MKKLLFVFTIIFLGQFGLAQEKPQFLEVDYVLEMKFDADKTIASIPAEYRAQVEESLRQEIKNGIFVDYKLKTNGTESVYKLQEKIDNNQSAAGMILAQITAADKEPLYKNIKEKYYLKPYNFGKAYLMKDSLQNYKWKITKEKEKIAGFDTYKATGVMNDSINVTAWYTPKINIKDGPDRIWGLPGLILKTEFNMNNMGLIITAKNVAVKQEEIKIEKPNTGQEVTEKEFQKEMEELQAKMKEMYGDGVEKE